MPHPRRKGDSALLRQLGANIRAARKAAKLTQEGLAEAAELDPRALQKIEAGEVDSQISTLARLQHALVCDWDAILPQRR